nr:FtsK/SpoIIIE domain-containing protein [Mycobacterium lepraemurium]
MAPPIPLLPAQVDLDVVRRGSGDEFAGRSLLGVQERQLRPLAIYFARESHLLILGANGCGKTAALRTLCRELVRTNTAAQAQLVIVDFRRALLGIVESKQLRGYAMSPAALTALLPGLLDLLSGRMPPPDASQAQLRAGRGGAGRTSTSWSTTTTWWPRRPATCWLRSSNSCCKQANWVCT